MKIPGLFAILLKRAVIFSLNEFYKIRNHISLNNEVSCMFMLRLTKTDTKYF